MHNKPYALKLVQDRQNGLNNYSYSQIASLSGYKKLQIIRFANQLKEKDIDSMLVHGLTNKPSNNSPSTKEIEFIKNFKNKYPIISITQFQDIYHEDVIWNPKMQDIVKENNLKERSYSFYESLYEKFHWIKHIKHKCFNKEYETHPLREPSPQRGILIMIDGTPHDWFQNADTIYNSLVPIKEKYCINLKSKVRYVVPLVQTKNGNVRINKISSKANDKITEYLNCPKGGYYTYFDFQFIPYEKVNSKKLVKRNNL